MLGAFVGIGLFVGFQWFWILGFNGFGSWISKGLARGFKGFGSWFQRYRLSAFKGLGSWFVGFGLFQFFRIGYLSLLIQRCKKQSPEGNFFDGDALMPDERRIYPTKVHKTAIIKGES
jgi:hypothetical protein